MATIKISPGNLRGVMLRPGGKLGSGVEAVGGAGGGAARAAGALPRRRLRTRTHAQLLRPRHCTPGPAVPNT